MNSGLDPEALVLDEEGLVVPASIFLPPPHRRGRRGRLNHLSFDNAAVEMRPSRSRKAGRLTYRLSNLVREAKKNLGVAQTRGHVARSAQLSVAPSARLLERYSELDSVKKFGCAPSSTLGSDYQSRSTTPFVGASDTLERSAGFHIHQEMTYPGTTQMIVAVLDALLGLCDVAMNDTLGFHEQSQTRRVILGYGRAGEHRTRKDPSGPCILEYRTLSPWPLLSKSYVRWVLLVTRSVCRQDTRDLSRLIDAFPERTKIVDAINHDNTEDARTMWKSCISTWNDFQKRDNPCPQAPPSSQQASTPSSQAWPPHHQSLLTRRTP